MSANHIRAPGTLSDNTSTPIVPPGTLWTDEATGITYVYIYNAGASNIAAGDAVGVYTTLARGHASTTDATMFEVVDGTATLKAMSGIALGTITTLYYGWLYAKGFVPSDTVTTDGSIVAGTSFGIKDATATVRAITAEFSGLANGIAHADDVATVATGFTLFRTFWLY